MTDHVPVLCEEVVKNLINKPEGIYMDCTVGFGGHSEKILEKLKGKGFLIGIDIDPYALKISNEKLSKQYKNFSLHNCSIYGPPMSFLQIYWPSPSVFWPFYSLLVFSFQKLV